jgi:hypothetical protein
MMGWFRVAINIALTVLLLFDVALGVQAYTHGWPARVTLTEAGQSVETVQVSRGASTTADAWILAALVGANVLLVYLAWHFNKRPAVSV